jgi:virulence-associated protein VapD
VRKQISFDIDTNVVKAILGEANYTRVYMDIRNYMEMNGWIHIEGSVYMSKETVKNSDISFLIDNLEDKYPYISKCVRTMHQADISNIHTLDYHFNYDGTPGEFAREKEKAYNKVNNNPVPAKRGRSR